MQKAVRGFVFSMAVVVATTLPSNAQRKKKPEKEITQVLELPKEPPAATVAESQKLVFHVSPLSAKGLLTQQVRDGLKRLQQANRGAPLVKIRAFVAGSGDMRRVPQIISEELTEKRQQLPAVTVVQVGGLPLVGAQVVLESVASDRKNVNEHGLAFISGEPGSYEDASKQLQSAVQALAVEPGNVRRVTCFLSSLENVSQMQTQIATAFPKAAGNYVQLQRGSMGGFATCEAVAALSRPPSKQLLFAGPNPGGHAVAALVGPGRVAMTGLQMAFRPQDGDVKLAFERLGKTLQAVSCSYKDVALINVYSLSQAVSDTVKRLRPGYISSEAPPAATVLAFEGLPSLDASFGMDVVAVQP